MACIQFIAILETCAAGGDAADVVFGCSACESHDDILSAGDAVGLLALDCTEGLGVVAVAYFNHTVR